MGSADKKKLFKHNTFSLPVVFRVCTRVRGPGQWSCSGQDNRRSQPRRQKHSTQSWSSGTLCVRDVALAWHISLLTCVTDVCCGGLGSCEGHADKEPGRCSRSGERSAWGCGGFRERQTRYLFVLIFFFFSLKPANQKCLLRRSWRYWNLHQQCVEECNSMLESRCGKWTQSLFFLSEMRKRKALMFISCTINIDAAARCKVEKKWKKVFGRLTSLMQSKKNQIL